MLFRSAFSAGRGRKTRPGGHTEPSEGLLAAISKRAAVPERSTVDSDSEVLHRAGNLDYDLQLFWIRLAEVSLSGLTPFY